MSDKKVFLYSPSSNIPILCERPNWKNCPEHKHLSLTAPKVSKFTGDGNDTLIDDANDGIVSVDEYANHGESDPRKELIDSVLRMDASIPALASLRNRNIYEIRGLGVGYNFDVDDAESTFFGAMRGKCNKCRKTVMNGKEGVWMHKVKGKLEYSCPNG